MFEPNSALAPFNEPEIIVEMNHWPQTWGWYVLVTLGVIWILNKLLARLKGWWRNRYRREALSRLRGIASMPTPERTVAANELLKIVGVYVYGRELLATISDRDWYDLLNASIDVPVFTDALQSSMSAALYRGQELTAAEAAAYLAAIDYWLKTHIVELGDD